MLGMSQIEQFLEHWQMDAGGLRRNSTGVTSTPGHPQQPGPVLMPWDVQLPEPPGVYRDLVRVSMAIAARSLRLV